MLAYKDLTRRRDPETRLCLFCGVPSAKEKPRLPKRTGRELDRVRHLRSPVSPSPPIPQRCLRFHWRGEAARHLPKREPRPKGREEGRGLGNPSWRGRYEGLRYEGLRLGNSLGAPEVPHGMSGTNRP